MRGLSLPIRDTIEPAMLDTATTSQAAGPAGIEFGLSAEQRAIQETAREFARREIDPIVDEIDEAQRSRAR